MKKLYFLFIIVMTASISLFAQRQGLSLGGNVYFPVGDWADFASAGYGGSVSYEFPLERNIAGVIYSGYTYFGGDSEGSSWTMVPLVAGAKFYLSPELDWYIAALLGVEFVTAKTTLLLGEVSASTTEFAGNVNFGYEVKTSETGAVDISAGFVYINQLSYFGARLAYIFKL
ncbi:MAG: hypothetical protein ACM34M_10505 [Ignavibacteria bacterium]